MAKPYQFRDHPLAFFMALSAVAAFCCALSANADQQIEIPLEDGCCQSESCPMLSKLSAEANFHDVRHDGDSGEARIRLAAKHDVSSIQIWDAVARAHGHPIPVVVNGRRYRTRPLR